MLTTAQKLLLLGARRWTPARLFSAGQAGIWYQPSDPTTVYQDSAATTAGVIDSPVGKRLDKSGRGNHAVQATAAARPTWKLTSSIYSDLFDATDDGYGLTFSAGTLTNSMDAFVAIKKTAGAAQVTCANALTGVRYFGYAANGSASPSTDSSGANSTYFVDGTQLAGGASVTAGTVYTALNNGAWHILEVRDLDLSAWAGFFFGQTTVLINGSIGGAVVCPAQDATTRARIRTWLGREVGLSV